MEWWKEQLSIAEKTLNDAKKITPVTEKEKELYKMLIDIAESNVRDCKRKLHETEPI